jgi:uncharacterized membrane protein HdeD (DUF308 family)
MKRGLMRSWWAVGLRGIAALLFGAAVLVLPRATLASLVLLFAAYLTADGALAIWVGLRGPRRGARWWMMVAEGTANLGAAAVLAWPTAIVIPLVHVASAWAVVTGALLLAAARRLSRGQGRWFLVLAGALSAAWGALAAAIWPATGGDPRDTGLWLVAYALLFGVTLAFLSLRMKRRKRNEDRAASELPGKTPTDAQRLKSPWGR